MLNSSRHISWVMLTPDFAFKIKKPVHFDFLDFSSLALRRKFREELRLNRRLAPGTYLGVLPIGLKEGQLHIAKGIKNPVDYAVWMRREDDSRQLDQLLRTGAVQPEDLRPLAHQLAVFHREHALLHPHFDPEELVADFADLFHHEAALTAVLGADALHACPFAGPRSAFIAKHAKRLRERAKSGLWVDGHGDLHSRNIFLTDPPIVFDCIEFAPHLRRLDVLNGLSLPLHGLRPPGASRPRRCLSPILPSGTCLHPAARRRGVVSVFQGIPGQCPAENNPARWRQKPRSRESDAGLLGGYWLKVDGGRLTAG